MRSMAGSKTERLTTERVVTAAGVIVDADGVDGLSLTRVASALGVTQPALYNHVDGIHDLLRRLALHAREDLVNALRNAAVGRTRDDAVRAVAKAWREFVRSHGGLYAVTDRYPVAEDEEMIAAVGEVVGVLEAVLQGYGLSVADRRATAWSLRSAFHGFCVLEMEGGHPYPEDIDGGFGQLVDLLCAGIAEREAKKQPASRKRR